MRFANWYKHKRAVPSNYNHVVILSAFTLLALLAACVPDVSTSDGIERQPSLVPTATVLPFLPTEDPLASVGRNEPTSAALVAEGDFDEDPQLTVVVPTAQYVPLTIVDAIGGTSSVGFYGAAQRPAPNILLLHDSQQDGDVWFTIAPQLQAAGYNVFAANLSGRRLNPADQDWVSVIVEIEALAAFIGNMQGIAAPQLTIMGLGTGADAALFGCAAIENCSSVVAVSPRNNLPDLSYVNLNFGTRRVLLFSADDDPDAVLAAEVLVAQILNGVEWQRYASGGRGSALLRAHPDAVSRILQWLNQG